MTSRPADLTSYTSLQIAESNMTSQSVLSDDGYLPNSVQNLSVLDGCIEIRFSRMEFLPWDNPDNVISDDAERLARQIRISMLPIMFVIGGPANVINMAVFFTQGLQDRVNLCLFALSLGDELYLIASILNYGEEFYLQFTDELVGPVVTFMVNNHLNGFLGLVFVSMVMSAIIACERCFCILRPLKYQTLLSTRTMAFIIIAVYVIVVGLFFVVVLRYSIARVHDPEFGIVSNSLVLSEVYLRHRTLVDNLDSIVFGAGLSGGMMAVVVTATIITTVRLRQVVNWRSETSSSLSSREIALTKMLVGSSVFFIVFVSPACLLRVVCLFLPELNIGRRHQNFYLTCLWITEASGYINSSFNIFVYYGMGSRYRETFWALFNRRPKQEKLKAASANPVY